MSGPRDGGRLPNLVLFNPDQWRGKDVHCLGNHVIATPHTDALAAEGVAFSRCFAQNPVCTPSRCSFFTGWYPHTRGHRSMHHMLAPDEPFLLRELLERGYTVWWGGKNDAVRLQDRASTCTVLYDPDPSTYVTPPQPVDYGDRLYYAHYQGRTGDRELVNRDDALVNGAVEWLAGGPPEPFCILLTLTKPHVPFEVEEPYYSMYDRAAVPAPLPAPEPGTKTAFLDVLRERMDLCGLAETDLREILAVYYGMITKVDAALGRLVAALRGGGYWDDTAVLLFSDHGEYAGDYGLVEKTQTTFEDDMTLVPLVMKLPSWVRPRQDRAPVDALVELVDVYATVAELAGLTPRHTPFGRSLVPLYTGEASAIRDAVFSEGGALPSEPHTHEPPIPAERVYWPRVSLQNERPELHGKAVMVRTERWKYVMRLLERDELYDLRRDPEELHNLVDDPPAQEVAAELRTRIARWFLETGDAVPYRVDPRSAVDARRLAGL